VNDEMTNLEEDKIYVNCRFDYETIK